MERNMWIKSTKSGNAGACVEVKHEGTSIRVRNSRFPDGSQLVFTEAEWDAFLNGADKGEFDL